MVERIYLEFKPDSEYVADKREIAKVKFSLLKFVYIFKISHEVVCFEMLPQKRTLLINALSETSRTRFFVYLPYLIFFIHFVKFSLFKWNIIFFKKLNVKISPNPIKNDSDYVYVLGTKHTLTRRFCLGKKIKRLYSSQENMVDAIISSFFLTSFYNYLHLPINKNLLYNISFLYNISSFNSWELESKIHHTLPIAWDVLTRHQFIDVLFDRQINTRGTLIPFID